MREIRRAVWRWNLFLTWILHWNESKEEKRKEPYVIDVIASLHPTNSVWRVFKWHMRQKELRSLLREFSFRQLVKVSSVRLLVCRSLQCVDPLRTMWIRTFFSRWTSSRIYCDTFVASPMLRGFICWSDRNERRFQVERGVFSWWDDRINERLLRRLAFRLSYRLNCVSLRAARK
jgi:hypothetical protein